MTTFSSLARESFLLTVTELRDKILTATDFLVNDPDVNLTKREKSAVVKYRSALKNITDKSILSEESFQNYFLENKPIPNLDQVFPAVPECIQSVVGSVFSSQ